MTSMWPGQVWLGQRMVSLCIWDMTSYQCLVVTLYVTGVNMLARALWISPLVCESHFRGQCLSLKARLSRRSCL